MSVEHPAEVGAQSSIGLLKSGKADTMRVLLPLFDPDGFIYLACLILILSYRVPVVNRKIYVPLLYVCLRFKVCHKVTSWLMQPRPGRKQACFPRTYHLRAPDNR